MGVICFSFNDLMICIRSNTGRINSVGFSCSDSVREDEEPLLLAAKKQMIEYLSGDRRSLICHISSMMDLLEEKSTKLSLVSLMVRK